MSAYRENVNKAIRGLDIAIKNGSLLTRDEEDMLLARLEEFKSLFNKTMDGREAGDVR